MGYLIYNLLKLERIFLTCSIHILPEPTHTLEENDILGFSNQKWLSS